jgi:arginine utilization protein RocB
VVKTEKNISDTVILTGHIDVVEADGPLKELMFDPERYTAEIVKTELADEARADADSGNWMFGRGVADMKSGIAAAVGYGYGLADGTLKVPVNVAFIFVPDEENNSCGMLGAMSFLEKFESEMMLKFIACINTEPSVAPVAGGETTPSVYLGSIGKINPFMYVMGKRMHLGEYYKGVSAALIASYLNLNIEGNLELADVSDDTTYLPVGCHIIKNIAQKYCASIADRIFMLYGYLPAKKYPDQIIKELADIAEKSLKQCFAHIDRIQHKYIKNEDDIAVYAPKVILFSELQSMYVAKFGDSADLKINSVLSAMEECSDERSRALKIVTEMVDSLSIQGPCIIVGYMFPCYPFIENREDNKDDISIKEIACDLVKYGRNKYGREIVIREFFEGVSDLSYCGLRGRAKNYSAYFNNVPGWGRLYGWPVDDMEKYDFPVVNVGPLGRDIHKYTERVDLEYAVSILPDLLDFVVKGICHRILNGEKN